ncbi:MAG: IMP dehydrogenase [Patescibacteria group bacterium]
MNKTDIVTNKVVKHEALTFDDVLLLPGYADFKRADVDLTTVLHKDIVLKLPIISSPMDTVTETKMAICMAQAGCLGILHRNSTVASQAQMVTEIKKIKGTGRSANDKKGHLLVGAAVGAGSDLEERVAALTKAKVDVLVIDSGHGYTSFVAESVKRIKKIVSRQVVMAGNIATFDGALALIKAGADILRVGMGPGSICTTRIITGMGVPQLSAVAAAVRATENTSVTVVADGGIKQIGDMAKALAFGAQAVMLGSLLARFNESPGEIVEMKGKKFKSYRGMGSIAAMKKGGAERYGQSKDTQEKKLIAEGVEGLVEYQGAAGEYLNQVSGSLRSSFYYIGARNIPEFFTKSRVIKISQAGLYESHPHSIVMTDAGGNYNTK